MKYKLLIFIICMFVFSCDFNINDMPGPQMSSSVAEAKKHGTFLYAYRIKGDTLNGEDVAEIFAEKQYWLDEGAFSKYKIDNSQSQLVVISKGTAGGSLFNQYDISWKVRGFKSIHSGVINKHFKGIALPDTIPIDVMSINGRDSTKVIGRDTLFKIKK